MPHDHEEPPSFEEFMRSIYGDLAPLPGGAVGLGAVEDSMPELVVSLARLRRGSALGSIGALLTVPELHANTLRLEVLAHLALAHSRGSAKVTRAVLQELLNQHFAGTPLASWEDPVEDVFVSNVITPAGNHRIFEGTWESSDFFLQDVLRALWHPGAPESLKGIRRSVGALLKLSEAVASRLGLTRFTAGSGEPKGRVSLPARGQLRSRASALRFTAEDFHALHVDLEELAPFVVVENQQGPIREDTLGGSYFERHPLVQEGGTMLLALPSAVSPAIRRFVIENALAHGEMASLSAPLRRIQASQVFNEGLPSLGTKPLSHDSRPSLPDALVDEVDDVFCSYDSDKFAHIVVLHDDLTEFDPRCFSGLREVSAEKAEALVQYLRDCARSLADRDGYMGGLTVVVPAGIGRGTAAELPVFPRGWGMVVVPLPDWLSLAAVDDASLLELWKLKEGVRSLEAMGVDFENANGDFNLYAYWVNHEYRLLPPEFELGEDPQFILLATDFVTALRSRFRRDRDRHAAVSASGRSWVEIERFLSNSFFREARTLPVYASPGHARAGSLMGLVETPSRVWWVAVGGPPHAWQKSFVYQIWECTLSWLARLAPLLEESIGGLPEGPIEFRLELQGFEALTQPGTLGLETEASHPSWTLDEDRPGADIEIPVGFSDLLNQSANAGERALLEAIANSVVELASAVLSQENVQSLLDRVLGSEDARFLHAFSSSRPRDLLAHVDSPAMRLVSRADTAEASFLLALRSGGDPGPGEISGGEVAEFFNRVVDGLWGDLRDGLADIQLESLVMRSLWNLESIHRDAERWRRTARALQAIYSDPADVLSAATQRESERNQSSICFRSLIEMAVCTCPTQGGRLASDCDLDWFTGRIAVLIDVATSSDALHWNLVEPRVLVSPCRDVTMDRTFHEKVIVPYMKGSFEEQFESAAMAYDSYFDLEDSGPLDEPAPVLVEPEFDAAFGLEFGVTVDEFLRSVSSLERIAVEQGQPVCRLSRMSAAEVMSAEGIAPRAVQNLLERLMLPVRPRWDEQTPAGFTARDWYPWRFGRRLSVIARPLIPTQADGHEFAFGVSALDGSIEYLLDRSFRGELSEGFFSSDAMRSWIGTINDRLGNQFSEEVAARVRELGWRARSQVKMTEVGAPAELGDIDVLAWSESPARVFAIECKRLRRARTVAEIGEQLRRFRGEAKDDLARHIRRSDWLKSHVFEVGRLLHLNKESLDVQSLLVTNTVVPLNYVAGLSAPSEDILAIDAIGRRVNREPA